jgi:hypothetical protein
VEKKCNCYFNAPLPEKEIPKNCNSECASTCINPFSKLSEVFECVSDCGCDSDSSIKMRKTKISKKEAEERDHLMVIEIFTSLVR